MRKNHNKFLWSIALCVQFLIFGGAWGQTTLISPTGDGGFENGATPALNNWVAVNSSTDNWIVGSTPIVSAGTKCTFISSGAAAWTYSQISTIQHLYYDVTIPTGQTKITLNFKWKVGGEGTTTSDWDNLKIFWGTTALVGTPVANTAVSAIYQVSGTGSISGMYKLSSASYNNETISLTGISGSTYRLVLSWKSDNFTIANPPAAVDEISLVSAVPVAANAAPISFNSTLITNTGMTINWVDNSTNETSFKVYRSTDNVNFTLISSPASTTTPGTGTAYSLSQTGLTPGVTYYYRIAANFEAESAYLTGNSTTTAAATYYYVGAATGSDFSTAASWNTNADGTGSNRTVAATTDILIVDGIGTSNTAGGITIAMAAAQSLGALQITNSTAVTIQSSTTATRTLTLTGSVGDELSIPSGSSLSLTNASQAAAIAFSTGTGMTGTIGGTLSFAGSTSNVITTTGGTGTLVTIASTGVVNLGAPANSLVGSTATLSFLAGSNCNSIGATTGAPPVPLATWGTTSTLTISGLTTSTTAPTNAAQSFGNIVFNCPLLTTSYSFFTTSTTAVIKGDLVITAAGATGGTGIFRALTSGTLTVNGNVNVLQGRLQSANGAGTFIVLGNTTNSTNGILEINGGTYSQRGTTFTNNGVLTGTVGTLQFLNFSNIAQTYTGSGSVLTNLGVVSLQNGGGLTLSGATNQLITLRVNLFAGTITGSAKLTMGTGAALTVTTQIGAAGLTNPGGSFDAIPTFNLGTGAYNVIYAQESVSRTTGFEIPSTRSINALTLSNSNGLTIAGGAIATGTLTFSALSGGNITTTSANLLTVTGTATTNVVRTLATAYVNGPLAITLPANLVTGSTYTLPIGKSVINPFVLVNPTTGGGGTVTVQSEVFDASTGGTPGNLMGSLNTNKYWATSVTSGSANLTNTLIQLTDAPNGADAIAGSATLAGAYDLVGGLTTTSTTTSLTTTVPPSTSLLGFYVMGNKATPTLASLAITPSGNACPHVARTVSVNVTPGGATITGVTINYSINGATPIVVNMTNTTNNGGLLMDSWTGTIPTVTPTNATITWSVLATDANLLTKSQTGVSYTDEGLGNEVITITSSVANFCGTGGNVTLTASSSIPGVVYTWTSLTSSATLLTSTGTSVTASITETSDFKVTGTPNNGSCPSEAYKSVGVYALPSATVTTTASGVCPGTSATINSGLSAGNFISLSVTPNIKTAPSSAVTICNAGVGTPEPVNSSGVSYDDGGWPNIPIGFNFNFFGTNYTTLNAGTNGNVMFGTFNATALADFTFTTLPSATEPFNMVALLAMDNNLAGATGGSVKYWTEGYAPNRKFIISYENVKEFGDTKFSTFQGVFYETTGIIEVHVGSSTNIDRNKVTGVNNGNGTIGVLAYASGTTASATNPISSAFAYRFSPPANYTTTWSASNTNGTSTLATGTNIFSQTVAPAISTTYSISYTNQTTGCTNALGSAQVIMSVLGTAAPTGVTTIASSSTVCFGSSVNLSLDYTGSTTGLTFQWESSIDAGSTWQSVSGATLSNLTNTPTVASLYRCKMISCGGTPSYSSTASVSFSNAIASTTPATRCGAGTATISATANSGASVSWYAAATGGSALSSGASYTTPTISTSTTYYASAEVITSASVSLGSSAAIDITSGTTSSTDGGMVFTTTSPNVVINSIDVLINGTGDLTIKLQNSTGTDIASTTVTGVTGSATALTNIVLPSSFIVPTAGSGYRILCTSLGTGLLWYYQTGAYPFSTSGVSITSGWGWGATSTDLRFVHKINLDVPSICASPRVAVPVTVNPSPVLTLSGASGTICSGVTTTVPVTITSNVSDFDTYSWSPSTGVSGNSTSGWLFNPTVTTNYTLSGAQTTGALCSNTAAYSITVNPLPSAITLTPASASICFGSTQSIVASGGNGATTTPSTLFNENFNSGLSSWTVTNGTTSPSVSNWIAQTAPHTDASGSATFSNFSTSNGGKFAYANPDAGGSGTTTNTVLQSPTFNTLGATSATLTFEHVYQKWTSGDQTVALEISIDNGTTWTVLKDYKTLGSQGTTTSNAQVTINESITLANTYLNQASVKIRYNYVSAWGYFWLIDNIVVTGYTNNISWSPTATLFTDAAATTAYAGSPTTVYAKPTGNTTYTATATNAAGCSSSASVAVTIATPSTQTLANNDNVWLGKIDSDWNTASNWVVYDGTNYTVATSVPLATDNVFIPQNNACVLNQPSIGAGTVAVNSVYIEPSAAVISGSGSLDVNGNFTNNGTFTPGTGTVSFTGTAAQQVTGATTFYNLTENNAAGLTLNNQVTVANNLTMTAGNITTSNLLTLGINAPATLTWTNGKVVGPMKRWMDAATNSGNASSLFPLGTATREAKVSLEYTVAPTTAGYLEAKYVESDPVAAVTNGYTPLTDQYNYLLENVDTDGYWEIAPSTTTGVDGGDYTLTLQAANISPIVDYQNYRIIKSPIPHDEWQLQGVHAAGTGTAADFTVLRTGMSGFSFFALASPLASLLPTELVSFAANCEDNNTVAVNWTTASEHNSDYFIVEKSRDGVTWNELKKIEAAGNSSQLINYSVADASDINGTVYYRLSQFDIDGASKVYDIVSTNCSAEKELEMVAYPNPSNGQFTVKIENAVGGSYTLGITDMQGKAFEQQNIQLETGTTVVKLNPIGLKPGVYLLQLVNASTIEKQLKLVVN